MDKQINQLAYVKNKHSVFHACEMWVRFVKNDSESKILALEGNVMERSRE